MNNNNKILQNIGLCRKAGFIICGFDPVRKELESSSGKIAGILTASDLSPKTLKEIKYTAAKFGTQVLKIPIEMDEIEHILKKRVGIIAVLDEGLFKTFPIDIDRIV